MKRWRGLARRRQEEYVLRTPENNNDGVAYWTPLEDTMTLSRLLARTRPTRREVMKSAALGSAAAIAAPYVKESLRGGFTFARRMGPLGSRSQQYADQALQ